MKKILNSAYSPIERTLSVLCLLDRLSQFPLLPLQADTKQTRERNSKRDDLGYKLKELKKTLKTG